MSAGSQKTSFTQRGESGGGRSVCECVCVSWGCQKDNVRSTAGEQVGLHADKLTDPGSGTEPSKQVRRQHRTGFAGVALLHPVAALSRGADAVDEDKDLFALSDVTVTYNPWLDIRGS